jgi:hypothetical protein
MVFNATFNNISVISWRSVVLVEETGIHRENHRPTANVLSIKHWSMLLMPDSWRSYDYWFNSYKHITPFYFAFIYRESPKFPYRDHDRMVIGFTKHIWLGLVDVFLNKQFVFRSVPKLYSFDLFLFCLKQTSFKGFSTKTNRSASWPSHFIWWSAILVMSLH